MKPGPLIAVALSGMGLAAGCGASDQDASSTAASIPATTAPSHGETGTELPSGAVGPSDSDQGGAAGEASPESQAEGPETGELSGTDEDAVSRVVSDYVDALNRHGAARVCSLFAPGALRLSELPVRRGGCIGSIRASIGSQPPGGGPAWRRTRIVEIKAVSIEGGGARVTATVIHRFGDRKYVSVEDDVIYLERDGERWLLAKPSGTFYRAVGYGDPPLRALTPP